MTNTSTKKEELHDVNYEKILDTLYTLLGDGSWGNFSEKRTLPNGVEVQYSLSHATGMSSSSHLSKYRSIFGKAPDWLIFCNPSHRISLCCMAQEINTSLPESFNQLLDYIKKYEYRYKKPTISGTVNLEKTFKILVKSEKLSRMLHDNFGSSKAELMISMMRGGVFLDDVDIEFDDFLTSTIHNESEVVWEGVALNRDAKNHVATITCYHCIYSVRSPGCKDVGFFLDFNKAKSYVSSKWGYSVIDAKIAQDSIRPILMIFKQYPLPVAKKIHNIEAGIVTQVDAKIVQDISRAKQNSATSEIVQCCHCGAVFAELDENGCLVEDFGRCEDVIGEGDAGAYEFEGEFAILNEMQDLVEETIEYGAFSFLTGATIEYDNFSHFLEELGIFFDGYEWDGGSPGSSGYFEYLTVASERQNDLLKRLTAIRNRLRAFLEILNAICEESDFTTAMLGIFGTDTPDQTLICGPSG